MIKSANPWLVAGLAASFLASSIAPPAYAQNAPLRLAQAGPQAGATMDINVFYDQLADHGTWVEHPDYRYVFVPADVGQGWRPYQEGRWVWTDNYGWYWDSDEPFGWATYHYGRWSYDPAYGWFWVPGDTWAPAWVKWRRGGGRTGWAPIAPDREGFARGRATHYDAPVAESWVFIDDQYMGEPDIGVYAAPIPEISVYLRAASEEYEPTWEDGYYVNRALDRRAYDRVARTRIISREIVEVDRSDDLFYDDDSARIGIFAPRIQFADRVAPPRRVVRTIEPSRRVVVRQYVRDDAPGLFAPSVALLAALDDNRRRELRERRYSQRDRYQREVEELERDRADRIRELRREANSRADVLERERREAIEQRRERLERFNQERRERARQVQAPGDAPRGAPRGDQPSRPDGGRMPGGQDQPDGRPGPQDRQQDPRGQDPRGQDQRGQDDQQQDRRRPDTDQRPGQQRPGTEPQRQPLDQRGQPQDAQQPRPGQQQDRRRPDAEQQRPDQQRPGTEPQRPDPRRQPQDADQPRGRQEQERRRPETEQQRPGQRPDAEPQRQQPDPRRQPQQNTDQPRGQQQQERRRPETEQRREPQRPDAEPQRQQPEPRRQRQETEQPRGQQQRQQMQQREDQGQQQERRRPERQQGGSNDDNARPDPRRQPMPPQ